MFKFLRTKLKFGMLFSILSNRSKLLVICPSVKKTCTFGSVFNKNGCSHKSVRAYSK